MKIKTIKQVLQKKFDAWAASITDETLREQVKKNSIITGGSIASMLMREDVNDFDIYFRDKATTVAVALYYVKMFKPKNKSGIEVPICVEHETDRVQVVVKSAGIASESGTAKAYEYFEGAADGGQRAEAYVGEVMSDAASVRSNERLS
jgi:hypothetical protein